MALQIGEKNFSNRVAKGIQNDFMREAVSGAQERMQGKRSVSTEALGNWEQWRELGEEIRTHTMNHLDFYLKQLSDQVSDRGGHVFFAQTKEEAADYVADVAKETRSQKIVKAKSMVTEEINLNQKLESMNCEVIETDLGEYILQLDDHDPPSHIVVPALHKNKEQIRDTFTEKKGYDRTELPEELALFAREQLRQEFLTADMGITGCNFAVAESGSISLVTNEGNAGLVAALPKTQVVVMGMERIVPTWEELEVLVTLLCRSAVGQNLTSYITGLTGPKQELEADGPEAFHLVIVDNGRSNILGTQFQSALHCIRCAACINVCPVYRHIGGHAYGSIYPGPIGAVLTPLLGGYEDYKELPYASSLCAACTDACPVKIPLHEHLIEHRRIIVEEEKKGPKLEKAAMKAFEVGAANTRLYNSGTKLSAFLPRMTGKETLSKGPGPLKEWTSIRDFPMPAKSRFRDWYKDRKKEGGSS